MTGTTRCEKGRWAVVESHRARDEPTIEDARAAARQRWGLATPYRVGYCVGLLGISCPNPYAKAAVRSAIAYREGLMEGASQRNRDSARQRQEGFESNVREHGERKGKL